jgi:hypothetical protein
MTPKPPFVIGESKSRIDVNDIKAIPLDGGTSSPDSEAEAIAQAEEATASAVEAAGGKVLFFDPNRPRRRKTAG